MHAGLLSQDCVKDGLKDVEHEVVEIARIYASDQVCNDVLVHPVCAASGEGLPCRKPFASAQS